MQDYSDQEKFQEILDVMSVEDLIRFRYRLNKIKRKAMSDLLSEEIEKREALEKREKSAH